MISVIIPCYNCAAFVRRSIESVLNQTFMDYELLLIDNKSTDGTIYILNEYQERYAGKVKVYHEPKKGAPAARNKGLSMARGEWIQFLDADDELHSGKLARQAAFTVEPGAAVIVGDYIVERNKGRLPENRDASNDPWKGLITSDLGITSSNLWKKTDLVAVNGWNEEMTSSQEYELMFRLLKDGARFIFDPSRSTIVHRKGSSISRSANKKKLVEIVNNRIQLRNAIKNYLMESGLLTRELSVMIDTYVYTELKTNSPQIPEFANTFMRQNNLNVPLDVVVKTNARLKLKQWFSFSKLTT